MPEEFDPTWEYREVDPEVEWAVYGEYRVSTVYRIPASGFSVSGVRKLVSMDRELFVSLWLDGTKKVDIMEVFNLKSTEALRYWRNKLKMPPRMVGNHHRAKQVQYMRERLRENNSLS